jgi:hypothetical protein
MEDFFAQFSSLTFEQWMIDILGAAVIIVITAAIVHFVTKALNHLINHDNSPLPASSLIINIIRATIWIIAISIMLDSCFGVDVSGLVTALGVGGIALSLGLKDTLSNLIGGIQVTFSGLVKPGDNIEVGSDTGVVTDVTWRHTVIENASGETVYIPNSVISTTALVHLPPASQTSVKFAVNGPDVDLTTTAACIVDAAKKAAGNVSPLVADPRLFYTEVTELGFKGKILLQVKDADKTAAVTDAIIKAIAPFTNQTSADSAHNQSAGLEAPAR